VNREEAIALLSDPTEGFERYLHLHMISPEQGGVPVKMGSELLDPQRMVVDALKESPCLIVNKPRQAGISSLALAWLLWSCMYMPGGRSGFLIANTQNTVNELWSRLSYAYNQIPGPLKAPTQAASAKELAFKARMHVGKVKIGTARGKDPALGYAIDRMVASEFGFWKDPEVWTKLQGTWAKRQDFAGIIESTPGAQGSMYHRLWLDSLAGKTRWKPVFVCWMDCREYTAKETDTLSMDEIRYAEKYGRDPEKVKQHLLWRRKLLGNLDSGGRTPEQAFDFLYPPDPFTGWGVEGVPQLPQAKIQDMQRAHQKPDGLWEEPQKGRSYMITCDPAGMSGTGDPSAWSLWDCHTRMEIGCWAGQIPARQLGNELCRIGKKYNMAELVIEANNPAVYATCSSQEYRNLYCDNGKAGYFRTKNSKGRAQACLAEALENGTLTVRSAAGLAQLASWTGDYDRQGGHHWDRLITYEMAAMMFHLHGHLYPAQPIQPTPQSPNLGARYIVNKPPKERMSN